MKLKHSNLIRPRNGQRHMLSRVGDEHLARTKGSGPRLLRSVSGSEETSPPTGVFA